MKTCACGQVLHVGSICGSIDVKVEDRAAPHLLRHVQKSSRLLNQKNCLQLHLNGQVL